MSLARLSQAEQGSRIVSIVQGGQNCFPLLLHIIKQ